MFGRSRNASFQLYGHRRSRWRLPGWLLWWLFGAVAGAAAVVYVQERHLPPRLSAAETAALRSAYAKTEAERARLAGADAERTRLADELAASRAAEARARQDLISAIDALPPDPRGGSVEVRAAQFEARGDTLSYEVVLTRDLKDPKGAPIGAVMQFTVSADGQRGTTLDPLPLKIGRQAIVRGQVPLPDGLRPRQTTVQVLDRPDGRQLGMRVLLVR